MARKIYTPDEKIAALKRCGEIGMSQASRETGIALQTLYKWRSAGMDEDIVPAMPQADQHLSVAEEPSPTASKAIKGEHVNEEIIRLRAENAAMEKQIEALKSALRAFTV